MSNGIVYCNRCGTQNSALAQFCANCGAPFGSDQIVAAASVNDAQPHPQNSVIQPPAYSPAVPAAARYGGFWIRFLAVIIDGLLVAIVIWPVSLMTGVIIGLSGAAVSMPRTGVHLVNMIVGFALGACASWLYEAGLESSTRQATLGKMVFGLKVTDLHGRRISFLRATARHFAKFLSGMILLIGYMMAGFTERKQALHDLIAGTLVARTL
jgi:uncharacterized RDD family membrane protein YckC